jgi:outer membrane protein assembly factor BamB
MSEGSGDGSKDLITPSEEASLRASSLQPGRRQMLTGAGALVLAGAVCGAAELIPIGGIESWTPRADTWPLTRYDLANTGSTTVAPPQSPSIAWSDGALGYQDRTTLVVGPERVYAGGQGLFALSRADGTRVWAHERVGSGRLALRGGTLYSAFADGRLGFGFDLLAVDAATGERVWQAEPPFEATSLLVADGGAFVGYDGGIVAHDAETGQRRWGARHANGAFLAVHGGDLYVADDRGAVTRFASRDALDVTLRSGPEVRWKSEPPATDAGGPPAVTGDRMLLGQRDDDGHAGVVACHLDSGTVAWTAAGDETGRLVHATAPAVVDDLVVAGLRHARSGVVERGDVVGLDARDGSVRWTTSLGDQYATVVAVASDLALVGTANAGVVMTGAVRAFDLDSGAERWRVDMPNEVSAIAPVRETVFVACRDGSVHALRD